MGEIRSAIDIALEKTADIHSDKTGADNRELKNAGKKAAGNFLSTGDKTILEKILSGKNPDQAKFVTEGAISIFIASLRLPSQETDLAKLAPVSEGLEILLPKTGMKELLDQVLQVFTQYLADCEQLGKALEQQFMPRLRAKQAELSKRYGKNVPIDPSHDPEYMAALTKNQHMIDGKYEQVITEVRGRIREAAGIEE